jgi:hypothetical protein
MLASGPSCQPNEPSCRKVDTLRQQNSNVNNIETKRREASIMGIFAKSKRNELVK